MTPINRRNRWLLSWLILLAVALNWLPIVDQQAQAHLAATVTNNAVVFSVVRSLNGVISVVQSAEIGIGVAGVSVGEILDPINDLIERFSGLLLLTLTALGIQQVLLLLTTSLTIKIVFSLCALLLLTQLWRDGRGLHWLLRFGLCFCIGRFLLSLQIALVWLFDWLYFDATGEQALSVLEATTAVIDRLKETLTKIDLSALLFGDTHMQISDQQISSQLSTSIVTLIVGLLFKSILIPLATLWLGYQLCRQLMQANK